MNRGLTQAEKDYLRSMSKPDAKIVAAIADMWLKPQWTQDKPTKAGYYFYHVEKWGDHAYICEVDGNGWVTFIGDSSEGFTLAYDGWWLGPITQPTVPKGRRE